MTIGWPQIIGAVIGCALMAGIIAYFAVTRRTPKPPPSDHWTDPLDRKKVK